MSNLDILKEMRARINKEAMVILCDSTLAKDEKLPESYHSRIREVNALDDLLEKLNKLDEMLELYDEE